jgi:TPR repeat protein
MSADQGNAFGQFGYGVCLAMAIGMTRDAQQAVEYYKLAADGGHALAQFNYAMCLEFGCEGIASAMRTCYVSGGGPPILQAMRGSRDGGQSMYGDCLQSGAGIAWNAEEAVKYYKLVAGHGHSNGENNYRGCLGTGTGIEPNVQEAVTYFKLSADQGNEFGQLDNGVCLHAGRGIPVNVNEALQ